MARCGTLPCTTISWCCLAAAGYDMTFMCKQCEGTGQFCLSEDCASSCPTPDTCYKGPRPNGPQCCCAGSNLGNIDTEKQCNVLLLGTHCILGCCRNSSVLCGNKCCGASTHGTREMCGRAPPNKTGGKSACCVSPELTLEQQLNRTCCVHQAGKNCNSKWQNETCCMWSSNSRSDNPDKLSECQEDCTNYTPNKCPFAIGVNCTSPSGNPAARGRMACCLSQGSPSKHDPCQPNRDQCLSFYQACPDQSQMGEDCSTSSRDTCCLPDPSGTCRKDCTVYDIEHGLLNFLWGNWGLICLSLMLFGFYRWCCRAKILSPADSVFISGVLSCSKYQRGSGLGELHVNPGAARLESELGRAGHIVMSWSDATSQNMVEAKDWMLRAAEQELVQLRGRKDTRDFVFQLFFVGHGQDDANGTKWLGTDSTADDRRGLHIMEDFVRVVANIHIGSDARRCGLSRKILGAQFIFWSDCCRTVYSGVLPNPESFTAQERESSWGQPQFHFIHSTLSRDVAVADGHDSTCFMNSLSMLIRGAGGDPLSVHELATLVARDVQTASRYVQRVDMHFTSADVTNIYMTKLSPPRRWWLSLRHGRRLFDTSVRLAREGLWKCLCGGFRPQHQDLAETLRQQDL